MYHLTLNESYFKEGNFTQVVSVRDIYNQPFLVMVPLPIPAHEKLKPHTHLLKSSGFESGWVDIEVWEKTDAMIAKIDRPVVLIDDTYLSKKRTDELMLFVNPVRFHSTGLLLNNNYYGSYAWPEVMYEIMIGRIYHDLTVPKDKDEILKHLLSLTDVNMEEELINAKSTEQKEHGWIADPCQAWVRSATDIHRKNVRDYFGYHVVGLI